MSIKEHILNIFGLVSHLCYQGTVSEVEKLGLGLVSVFDAGIAFSGPTGRATRPVP